MFVRPGTPQSEYAQFCKCNTELSPFITQETYDQLVQDVSQFQPQTLYEFYAKQLLALVLLPSKGDTYLINVKQDKVNVNMGFIYQRNYKGKMATNKVVKEEPKRGLFDFRVKVGNRENKTHYDIFNDLLRNKNLTLSQCEEVWKGSSTLQTIAKDGWEWFALQELSLMMFEQEVNWGEEDFQADSRFSFSTQAKPRDMLMGFTKMVLMNGNANSIPHWRKEGGKKTTPDFGGPYKIYEITLKNTYFDPYRNVNGALMQGAMKGLFLRVGNLFMNNPIWKNEYEIKLFP